MNTEPNKLKCPLCLEPNPACRYYRAPLPVDKLDTKRHVYIGGDLRSAKMALMYYDSVLKDHVRIYAM